MATALDRHGRLDILLNNAGGQYFVPAEGITSKGWRAVHRLNVDGTLAMSEAAYRAGDEPSASGDDRERHGLAPPGLPGDGAYGVARAAVEALTRELATAWASDHVSVIAVAIGRFDTESLRKYPAELWRSAAAERPAAAPRERRGVRLAGRAARVAARRGPVGFGRDDRRGLDNWTGPWPPPRWPRAARCRPSSEPPAEARLGGRSDQVGSGGRGSNPHHRLGRPRLYH